jgi:hypothetical protein
MNVRTRGRSPYWNTRPAKRRRIGRQIVQRTLCRSVHDIPTFCKVWSNSASPFFPRKKSFFRQTDIFLTQDKNFCCFFFSVTKETKELLLIIPLLRGPFFFSESGNSVSGENYENMETQARSIKCPSSGKTSFARLVLL